MAWSDNEIEELKKYYSDVMMAEEGGFTYFLIKEVKLPSYCSPSKVDVLLCPMSREGYTSRLFFANKITNNMEGAKTLNWNSNDQRILDRNWHAYSWKINKDDLRLAQMMADHLRAFQ